MLRTRVLTGLVLASIALLALFFLPTIAIVGITAGIGFLGALEWVDLRRQAPSIAFRKGYAVLVAIGVVILWRLFEHSIVAVGVVAILWVGLLAWVGSLVIRSKGTSCSPRLVLGFFTIIPALSLVPYLHGQSHNGVLQLLTVLLVVWVGDIGAYFGGRRFGRSALAPMISPGKTWEGALAGAILAVSTGAAIFFLFEAPPHPGIIFGVLALTAVASVLADLFESILKRSAGKKDSGNLLPGHGGILDRIDSLLGAVPVFSGLTLLF
ncbi:MAG: phosphatidate cytidylyltransferase [Acidiferrobacter sp.]|nr:phosphatidate cytidylyltransferase [Acidiferrobacter sp.]